MITLIMLSVILTSESVIGFKNKDVDVTKIWDKNGPMIRAESFISTLINKHYPTIQYTLEYKKETDQVQIKLLLVGTSAVIFHNMLINSPDFYDEKSMKTHKKEAERLISDLLKRLV